jgi:hypothetical protein
MKSNLLNLRGCQSWVLRSSKSFPKVIWMYSDFLYCLLFFTFRWHQQISVELLKIVKQEWMEKRLCQPWSLSPEHYSPAFIQIVHLQRSRERPACRNPVNRTFCLFAGERTNQVIEQMHLSENGSIRRPNIFRCSALDRLERVMAVRLPHRYNPKESIVKRSLF